MAELDTYTKLVAEIESWLNRANFTALTAKIPLLVEQGMRRIQKADLNRGMLTVDAAFSITGTTTALPSDFDRVHSFTIPVGSTTREINGSSIKKVQDAGIAARPNLYTIVGDNFYFGPEPDTTYTATLIYYKKLDIPSTSVSTNWVLTNEPDLLLWSSLINAAIWLKDDTRKKEWMDNYSEVLSELLSAEERMDLEGGSLVVTSDGTSY